MATVDIYKGANKLGSGTLSGGGVSITSYSGVAPMSGRNVSVTAGGRTIRTRVVTDAGSTLTLKDAWPFP